MRVHRLLLPAALLLVLPGAAEAARVQVTIDTTIATGRLEITSRGGSDDGVRLLIDDDLAGDGREPRLRIFLRPGNDEFGPIRMPEKLCRHLRFSEHSVITCERQVFTDVQQAVVDLGDGDDRVDVGPSRAEFRILGNRGTDVLHGGPNDDYIDVGQGRPLPPGAFAREAEPGTLGLDAAFGGEGDDTVLQSMVQGGDVGDHGGALLDGGPGDDAVSGSSVALDNDRFPGIDYVLRGGPGDDRVTGGPDADALHGEDGDDRLEGRRGNDRLHAGPGADVVSGEDGDDDLFDAARDAAGVPGAPTAADGADTFTGGPGQDSLSYATRTARVELSPNDRVANDGAPGERDQILTVEELDAGAAADVLFGVLSVGDGLADDWFGGAGDDLLLSGDGDDRLEGGAGRDTLRAGSGDDVLVTRDGMPEAEISCGSGIDEAYIDLTDPDPVAVGGVSGCETIARQAIREEPNVRVRGGGSLRRSGGRVRVPMSCPPLARSGCRGTLTLRVAGASRSTRYRLGRAERRAVAVPAPAAGPGTLIARQRDSRGRPKTTTTKVTIR